MRLNRACQVSKLIQEYRREHLTYWGSFSHVICCKLTAEVRLQVFFDR